MNTRKLVVAVTVAMATLALGAQVFAATQTRTKDQIKGGTCIKKYDTQVLDATQTKDQIKDGTCIKK